MRREHAASFGLLQQARILPGKFVAGVLQPAEFTQQPPDVVGSGRQAGVGGSRVERVAKFYRQPARPDLVDFFLGHCPEVTRRVRGCACPRNRLQGR